MVLVSLIMPTDFPTGDCAEAKPVLANIFTPALIYESGKASFKLAKFFRL